MKTEKLFKLEALRGIASVIVFFSHFAFAFFPALVDSYSGGKSMVGTPFFFLLNGPAAVIVFFTLSGFVLTLKYYVADDLSLITTGVTKRYFRLAGPVVLIILSSYLLFKFNLYYHKQAAEITGSGWLRNLGNADFKPNFEPTFMDALSQGSFFVFLRGDAYYCSNLWTMKFELLGSIIALLIAPVLTKSNWIQQFVILILLTSLCFFTTPVYVCFIAGSLLAYYYSKHPVIHISIWLKIIMIVISLMMLSYHMPIGFYSFLETASKLFVNPDELRTYIQMIGSLLLMYVFLSQGKMLELFNGRIGKLLGSISFPLYLVQVSVFCSFSSRLIIFAMNRFNNYAEALLITFAGTLIVSAICTLLLKYFDEFWVLLIDSVFKIRKEKLTS